MKDLLAEQSPTVKRLRDMAAQILTSNSEGKRFFESVASELEVLQDSLNLTRAALEESVKLQSHYAKLLNMHDGGERITFRDASAWILRLGEMKTRREGGPLLPGPGRE